MDIHHVGQLLDADFNEAVAIYRRLGPNRAGTSEGPVRVAFFKTPSAEFHLIISEGCGSPADALLDAVSRYDAAHVAFAVADLASAMGDARERGQSFLGNPAEAGLVPCRLAFVDPEGHVGILAEFVEPN